MTLDEYRKARATEVITGLALILWFGMVAAFVIKHAILLGLATLPASLMAGWMIGIGLGNPVGVTPVGVNASRRFPAGVSGGARGSPEAVDDRGAVITPGPGERRPVAKHRPPAAIVGRRHPGTPERDPGNGITSRGTTKCQITKCDNPDPTKS
jgi:hypothetical protein